MNSTPSFVAILPAAGSGTRFGASGGAGDKLMTDLGGRSVLQRSVAAFARRDDVGAVAIVTSPERFEMYEAHLGAALMEKVLFVPGGRERWESVLFGLRAVKERGAFVAVHDAARPLVAVGEGGGGVIDEAFRMARACGGALPCVAEPATLKRRDEAGRVLDTVSRRGLYQAQTPQCFELAKLLAGYERLLAEGRVADLTDDAQVYERMAWPVAMTQGSAMNMKITTAEDVAFARAVVAQGNRI